MLRNNLIIFFGAGLGGILRYWISRIVYIGISKNFPLGTLIVNISGCFLMGILYVLIVEKMQNMDLRAFILIGFLGGYTTFSAFSIETVNLMENGNYQLAFANIFLSVVLCLLSTSFGIWLVR